MYVFSFPFDLLKNNKTTNKLANWPALFTQFHKVMDMSEVCISWAEEVTTSDAPVCILHMIAHNHSIFKYTGMEGNFLNAAMHLAYLKEDVLWAAHVQNKMRR